MWPPVPVGVAVRRGGRLRCVGALPGGVRAPPPEARGAGGTRPPGGGGGPDFRRRHRLLPRWLGARGSAAAWPSGLGRGLGRWGAVPPNRLPPPPVQARALPGPAGGTARLELPSAARLGAGRLPHPHLPGPQEAAPPLDPGLRRVARGGGGRHGTRAEGPSWARQSVLTLGLLFLLLGSLALSRRRGRRGAPAEGAPAREEEQGHGPSLRDPRSSLYA